MKKQIILGSFLALATIAKTQTNSFPSSGNVSINTGNTVGFALDVSTSNAAGGIRLTKTGTSGAAVFQLNNNTGLNWGLLSLGVNDGPGAGNFVISDGTANRLFLSGGLGSIPAGNIGIGTTVPAAKLDILSTSGQLRLTYMTGIFSDIQTTSSGNLCFSSWSGKVGIGTNAPNAGLDLRSTAAMPLSASGGAGSAAYEYRIQQNGAGNVGSWILNSQRSYGFGEDASGVGHIWSDVNQSYKVINFQSIPTSNNPQVWLGTNKPQTPHSDFMFAVEGKIVAQSLYITAPGSPNWLPDYVFANDYKLQNLYDVEKYYKANKHLPEVPSASEVDKNGLNISEMNILLLKKVEELTIHMVEQQREIDELKTKIK